MSECERRFWSYVSPGSAYDCWEWQGCIAANGYGVANIEGVYWYGHRLSYTLHFGPIPDGLNVCHHCDNPPCCNPYHLFLGTDGDNVADKIAKGRHPVGEACSQSKLTEVQFGTVDR